MNFPVALVTAVTATRDNVGSARPGAPVVPDTERPRRARTIRAGVARGLIRVAHVIAPA
ncbi:hypothetical protein Aph02nite_93120 [Actinoplanes philippinensis]|uniref:Uncharacterized protein n=1 Tax=Actinoplanes philippinensis TaxID=35752 RepID=A0A1I2N1H8_9ACTN|nr:hypothetical protein [Actinoplanes philippinensis]GIE83362.1 hypothetical protein Aph02nite_93120 [Actinoplanes philippinensis]SFF97248.1 hypothetical protein SAMN05421541_1374 [Actinoplanes philippinensis]